MHRPAEMARWQGRLDREPGGERWHQRVLPLTHEAIDTGERGVVLLGICSDIGVRRNCGRPGAEKGPDAIRVALANQAWHLGVPCYDAGDLYSRDNDLEGLQREQAEWVSRLLELGHFPLVLGGGHEISLGSHLGLRKHVQGVRKDGVIGIINFDAHFDLRKSLESTSGTQFLQIAARCREEGLSFRYLCLGVSEIGNTSALFERAGALGAEWLLDEQLASWKVAECEERVKNFVKGCDFIHLSVDLDILPAGVAPGVSAPSPRGVSLEVVEQLIQSIRAHGGKKLKLADIAECNPDFDPDARTAKVAARLCHLLTRKER